MTNRRGGLFFNTAGDSFICAFEKVPAGLFATLIVMVFLDLEGVKARAGVTYGPVLVGYNEVINRDDIAGDTVNLSERLQSVAQSGEVIGSAEFSETVAIGERSVRWRVDAKPVRHQLREFYSDGTVFLLHQGHDFAPTLADLRDGRVMRVEAKLPWAGNVLLEFDVAGGAAAFAKIPCSEVPPRRAR